jgi:hypothetical protein
MRKERRKWFMVTVREKSKRIQHFFFLFPLDKRNTNIFSSSLSSAVFCCPALVFRRRRRRRRDIKDLIDLRHVLSSLSRSPYW